MNKQELRKIMRRRILNIKDKDIQMQNLKSQFQTFFDNNNQLNEKYIMAYMPLSDEPDITILFADIKNLCLPLITNDNQMQARAINNIKNDLYIGHYDILEPKKETKIINPQEIGLVIVPGRAFDREGNRLGRGKGFYDRFLKQTSAIKIALAFKEQIYENVPVEEYDVTMDYVFYINQ